MPDDLANRGPRDASRINVDEPWELSYWCDKLGVSAETLRAAVKEVGPMVTDVKRQLGK